MSFTPSKHQQDIFDFIKNESGNMVINAVAGSGKTTTIIKSLDYVDKNLDVLFLAFNKSIKKEIDSRLKSNGYNNVDVNTSHGYGYSTIVSNFDCEVALDNSKYKKLLNDLISSAISEDYLILDKYELSDENKKLSERFKLSFDNPQDKEMFFNNALSLVNLIRLYVSDNEETLNEIIDKYDIVLTSEELSLTIDLLMIGQSIKRIIDFTDMVYYPTLYNLETTKYDLVYLDECFPYNTFISTEQGKIKIGQLEKRYNDGEKLPMVVSFNEQTKKFEYKNIKKVWCNGVKDVYQIVLGGKRKVKSTKNHKYLTQRGWVEMEHLKVGDAIIANNESGSMIVTKKMEFIKTEKVYDMEVEDNHNFIVTSSTPNYNNPFDEGIVAHNCQDVNTAQRLLMLKAIKENGRFVSVGDKFQAIYSFAGSDSDAFEKLINLPNVKLFPLSKSYRCGKNIIKSVQHIVPHIEANESNPDGVIIKTDSVDNIEVGDMVLCRNTYPLVKLCLKFVSEGKKANVMGGDIGKTIIILLDQTKESDSEKAFARLYDKLNKTLERVMLKTGLSADKAMKKAEYANMLEKIKMIETIYKQLPEGNNSVNDISNKISSIFSDSTGSGILLSTIHKAKGLESKRVYIIHPELMPSKFAEKEWELEQENNLIYVARTRAISQLSYVTDYDAYDECDSEKVDTSNILIRDSKHIGNLGERHKLIGEIIDVKFIQNYNTNVYIVEDASGNILEHWGAIPQHFSSSKTKRIGVGTKISGTIKIVKHTSFNNINKTSFKCLKR